MASMTTTSTVSSSILGDQDGHPVTLSNDDSDEDNHQQARGRQQQQQSSLPQCIDAYEPVSKHIYSFISFCNLMYGS